MKLKALKTGKYSLHPAFGPVVDFQSGQVLDREFTEEQTIEIEKDGWGQRVAESKKETVTVKNDSKIKKSTATEFYYDLIKGAKSDSEKKEILQSYGVEYHKKTISKAKSVKEMIKALVKIK